MSVGQAIHLGFKTLRRARGLVLVFFIIYLVVAALLALAISQAIASFTGHSLAADRLWTGFDALWYGEFTYYFENFLSGYGTLLGWGAILFLLLNSILTGGALSVFARGGGAGYLRQFGEGCGCFAGRMLRLWAFSLIPYLLVFLIFVVGLGWLRPLLADRVQDEWPLAVFTLGQFFLALLVLGLVNLLFDYAKVAIVANDERSVLRGLSRGARFVAANRWLTSATYVLLVCAAGLLIAVYLGVTSQFHIGSGLTLLLWFLLAQVFFYFRIFLHLGLQATELCIYAPPPASSEVL